MCSSIFVLQKPDDGCFSVSAIRILVGALHVYFAHLMKVERTEGRSVELHLRVMSKYFSITVTYFFYIYLFIYLSLFKSLFASFTFL